jgi:hypothetical protein
MLEDLLKRFVSLSKGAIGKRTAAFDLCNVLFLGMIVSFFSIFQDGIEESMQPSVAFFKLFLVIGGAWFWALKRGIYQQQDSLGVKAFAMTLVRERLQSITTSCVIVTVILFGFFLNWSIFVYLPLICQQVFADSFISFFFTLIPLLGYLIWIVEILALGMLLFVGVPFLIKEDLSFLESMSRITDLLSERFYHFLANYLVALIPLVLTWFLLWLAKGALPFLQSATLWTLLIQPIAYGLAFLLFMKGAILSSKEN